MMSRAGHAALSAPILFRLYGEEVWELGTVENLSGTGVLFRARSFLTAETPLEVKLLVPDGTGVLPLRMLCRAEVLRSRRATALDSLVSVRFSAIRIGPAVNPLRSARPY